MTKFNFKNSYVHKELYTKNVAFDPDLNDKLQLLYEGGFNMQKNAAKFLNKLSVESQASYDERKGCVSYIPFLSQFVTTFSSSLFSEDIEIHEPSDADNPDTLGSNALDEFYKEFSGDCDLAGNTFNQVLWKTFDRSLYEIKAYLGVDFPKQEDEDNDVNRGYVFKIDYKDVIDWKYNKINKKLYDWVKLFYRVEVQDSPLDPPMHYYEYKIWVLNEAGVAEWYIYQSPLFKKDKSFSDQTEYTLEDQGVTTFTQIPIIPLCIPKGFHVGLQEGPTCIEHYQRRSFLVSNSSKTAVSIGVVKVGPEVSAPGDAVPADLPTPRPRADLENSGWVVIKDTDDVEIVEATGNSHKFIAEELKELETKMLQTLKQMSHSAQTQSKSLGRSAASKQEDRKGTEMLLEVYRSFVYDFAKAVYNCISKARGEDIMWSVRGLSTRSGVINREDLTNEVKFMMLPLLDSIKSPTFQKKYKYKLATDAVGEDITEAESMLMEEEIETEVEEDKKKQEELEKNPPPVVLAPNNMQPNNKMMAPKDNKEVKV